eukprot:jgi/Tetstr1/453962/TSEL_040881.t1
MHQNQDILMLAINRFYSKADNIRPMVSVVHGSSPASLRMIEWFITNHAKRNDVILARDGGQFNVYHSYRSALKTFSKEQFDPFRRHERIRFVYGDGPDDAIETTVGQLNFFKWAIETGVLDYIHENKRAIERAMVDGGVAKRAPVAAAPAVPAPGGGDRAAGGKAGARPVAAGIHQRVQTTLSFD